MAPPPEPQLALTAGQLKAARQQRIDAERAARQPPRQERSAALPRAGQATAPTAAPIGTSLGTPPPVPWGRYGAQLLAMLLMSISHRSLWFLILGLAWVALSLKQHKPSWLRFLVGVFLIGLVVQVIDPR